MILRKPVTISIEHKIITKIDEKKGKNEPRSRFIEDILSDFLRKNTSSVTSKPNHSTKLPNEVKPDL